MVATLGILAINNLSAQTLEAHFKFDNNLNDETSNFTLSTANAPNFAYVTGADGTANGAISGLGVADYLETNENLSITGAADRTVTTWIKTNAVLNASGINRGIVTMGHKAAQKKFTLLLNGDKVRNDTHAGGGNTGILTIFDDAWHLLAVVYDNATTTSTIYVDGVSLKVINWATDWAAPKILATSARHLLIGNDVHDDPNPRTRGFEGAIDDVRVYTGTLTQGEIQALYDSANLSTNGVSLKSVNVYPNPVQDQLFIDNDEVETVEIYDMVGRKISAKTVTNNSLSLGSLSKGIYMLSFNDRQNNYISSLKVVKE